jgi:hypothetical protein
MGFETVMASEVKIEKPAPVPVGDYVFQLQPGASYRVNQKTNVQELNVRFDITEGEHQGRVVWVNYPDPAAILGGKPATWSNQALKKLEISLGTDALPGEDWATYLNRVATNAHSRVRASVIPGRAYVDKNGTQQEGNPQFGIFTVAPAA